MKKTRKTHITCFLLVAFSFIASTATAINTSTTTSIFTCSTDIAPDNATFSAAADNGTFQYLGLCGAMLRASHDWISTVEATSTNGPFTVTFSVAENTGAAREGYIKLVLQPGDDNATFTILQAGIGETTTTTSAHITTTTTSVPQCTFQSCNGPDNFCTPGYCSGDSCIYSLRDCGWGQCLEDRDKCVYSLNECLWGSIYGENSPETEMVRRYRDQVLAASFFGRRCIDFYYWLSPKITPLLDEYPTLGTFTAKTTHALLPGIEWHLHRSVRDSAGR